jgi:hypothetical protein
LRDQGIEQRRRLVQPPLAPADLSERDVALRDIGRNHLPKLAPHHLDFVLGRSIVAAPCQNRNVVAATGAGLVNHAERAHRFQCVLNPLRGTVKIADVLARIEHIAVGPPRHLGIRKLGGQHLRRRLVEAAETFVDGPVADSHQPEKPAGHQSKATCVDRQ